MVAVDVVREATRALEAEFGIPLREPQGDPMSGLVLAILSQNTTDRNRDRAFRKLRKAFPTWKEVVEAGPSLVGEKIREGGLWRLKAARIVRVLRQLDPALGGAGLEELRDLPVEEAEHRLLAIPGVGKKTARCVLLFELGMDSFPADTHVLRVTRRLGWIPENASADRAHDILQRLVPSEAMHSLHVNLIRLGRTVCRPRHPRCPVCPILRWCPHGGKAEAS